MLIQLEHTPIKSRERNISSSNHDRHGHGMSDKRRIKTAEMRTRRTLNKIKNKITEIRKKLEVFNTVEMTTQRKKWGKTV